MGSWELATTNDNKNSGDGNVLKTPEDAWSRLQIFEPWSEDLVLMMMTQSFIKLICDPAHIYSFVSLPRPLIYKNTFLLQNPHIKSMLLNILYEDYFLNYGLIFKIIVELHQVSEA